MANDASSSSGFCACSACIRRSSAALIKHADLCLSHDARDQKRDILAKLWPMSISFFRAKFSCKSTTFFRRLCSAAGPGRELVNKLHSGNSAVDPASNYRFSAASRSFDSYELQIYSRLRLVYLCIAFAFKPSVKTRS